MRAHVENDLYISADGRQYTLERKRVIQSGDNAGDEVFTPIGYFSSLNGAVQAIAKLKISESTATTLKELLEAVERIREDINHAVTV